MGYKYQEPKMHWFWQFVMNVAISFLVAGCIYGVGVGALHKKWGGEVFWGLFGACLLACYGIWALFIHDKNDGGGTDWTDELTG